MSVYDVQVRVLFWAHDKCLRHKNKKLGPGGEMVYALVSGTSVSNDVKVRVLSWAPKSSAEQMFGGAFYMSSY